MTYLQDDDDDDDDDEEEGRREMRMQSASHITYTHADRNA